tara:strand:- start:1283 stop:2053 length:771 start_codon:yes stop_codon:yes gene_type:complete
MNLNSEENLVKQLTILKAKYSLIGIKSEFEAEGSSLGDISRLRSITNKLKIKLYVKIGGVEAVNDIYNCIDICVDGIIAPMVETKFGAKKFLDIFDKIKLKTNPALSINIETKSGVENLKEILKISSGKIKNVTVGRSDLSGSYFSDKVYPNSNFILKKIRYISNEASKHNIITTVGGSVNAETIKFYSKIKNVDKFLSRIETRKVILPTNSFLKKPGALKNALKFEEMYIMQKKELYDLKLSSEILRLSNLNTRK